MSGIELGHIILTVVIVVGFGFYFNFLGESDLLWESLLQAIRWVMVGIVLAVAADSYISADFFSVKLFWVIFSVGLLMLVEHELLRMDKVKSE